MRTKWWAVAGLVVVLICAALVNISRADRGRKSLQALPEPSVTTPGPDLSVPNRYGLTCNARPGQAASEEANVPMRTAGHPDLAVISARCSDSSGERYPSLVHVIDHSDDDRIIATLIRPAQNLHVVSVAVQGSSTTVTATAAGPLGTGTAKVPPANVGSIYSFTFTATATDAFAASAPKLVAPACKVSDVRLKVTTGARTAGQGSSPPTSGTVSLTNSSPHDCVIEGYPAVVGVSSVDDVVTAHTELVGPSGRGVLNDTAPPIVLVPPGRSTSAAIDSADLTPAGGATLCTSFVTVLVGLPTGEMVGGAPIDLRACDFQVHPFVSGLTGTTS
ncbi:DUF4232 domain-containing protein [Jatrophihabitans sp. DSM 45814]